MMQKTFLLLWKAILMVQKFEINCQKLVRQWQIGGLFLMGQTFHRQASTYCIFDKHIFL